MKEVRIFHSHIEVTPYEKGDCPQIEKLMSKYDIVTHKSIPIAYYIEDNTLYLPRGVSITLLEKYFGGIPAVEFTPDKYSRIKKGVASFKPKSTIQENAIKFLCSEDDYAYTGRYSQFGLNLDTGDGKTYATITSILKLKLKTIVITHQEKLKYQWIKTLDEMTTFPIENICDISGSDVMDEIMSGDVKAEIYFVNHQTLQAYAKEHGWKSIREFFKKIKVGIKVIDESHKFFQNIFMIDNFSNCFKTFYLTATFGRGDESEIRIYNRAFSSLVRYGEETYEAEEKRKHIKLIVVYFASRPNYNILPNVKSNYGFSAYKYIDYELSEENNSMMKVLFNILEQTRQLSGKTLVVSPKTDSVDKIADAIEDKMGLDVGVVYSKNSSETNNENLQKEVISSTIKSIGEGVDIKGLRVLINLEPIGGKNLASQLRGRLREYSADEDTYLFYPVDTTLPESTMLLKRILPTMKKKCKEIIFMKMNV